MSGIKIHVFHTGAVCVAPDLPFGGDHCNPIKASGIFQPRKNRLWLPVSAYLIEHPKGKFLVDTGWARAMSPKGVFDKKAQIKSLGSLVLYEVNQGQIPLGECVDEQLAAMGIKTSDIDAVLLMQLTRLLVPHMVERGYGMVLNLSSVAAFSAGPYMSVYYATKAYVLSFSEALSEELAGTGVTVTALCPGPTATDFESAASMGTGSTMFRHAASAAEVARDGYAAMRKGKVVCLQGMFTKAMALESRLVPRSVARKLAMRMNR